ncbi:DoxX family protein [Catellatospora sp. NPDC049609]|uniref:DoxX family protein n=1 Tax=Catellatospora sp. NPDC049609 TaxID=3155505 RepID=UPI0034473469
MMYAFPPTATDVVKLLARIGFGVVFTAHGCQKLFVDGMDATAAGFKQLGVPLPTLSAWIAALLEFLGGMLLIVGLAVPIVGTLLFLDMLGAYLLVHIGKGLFVGQGGAELVIALGLGSLLIAAVGAGRYSLDHLLFTRRATHPHPHRGPDTIP